ncbi:hypothetical protein [Arthrobacter sp. Soil762]|uniref:hypothetical protein n=1 Tax=Arthrobacter sp. Soil762 TaxID=1736401 RepID=UPI0012E3E36C|nr:hypothetical protein [Arthrobacter sp. Soil762]
MIDIIGWLGSVLVAASLLQKRMIRLRIINLIACLICIGYNWYIQVWPMVGMNVLVGSINAYYLAVMFRHGRRNRSRQGAEAHDGNNAASPRSDSGPGIDVRA